MGILKLIFKFGDELLKFWHPIIIFLRRDWEVTLLVIVSLFVIYILSKKYMGNVNRKKSG